MRMNHQHPHQPPIDFRANSAPGEPDSTNGTQDSDIKMPHDDKHPDKDHLYHSNMSSSNHPSNFQGHLNEFEHHSPNNYLDSNWASSLLMDPNHDILYNIDLPGGNNQHPPHQTPGNSIMQNIQYQNNIHPDGSASRSNEPKYDSNNDNVDDDRIGHGPSIPDSSISNNNHNNSNSNSNNYNPSDGPGQDKTQAESTGAGISPASTSSAKGPKQRRPCDHCRRRKTKCVIIPNTNNCVQCESKSLTCTYTSQAIKRKAADQEDSTSKKKAPTDSKDPKSLEQSYNNSNLALLQGDQHVPTNTNTSGIVPPNVPIREVAPVQDYSSMSNSLLKKTLSLQFPRSSFYVGPTSYLYDINLLNMILDAQNNSAASSAKSTNKSTPSQNGLGKIEQVNLSETISLRKVGEKVQFVLKDDQSPHSYQTMSNDVDTIEKFIAPHGQILIDLYFRIIHPSYPILHKKVFLEKYSRTHREFSAPLLAAVYVLAIQWWDYDPQLNRFPKPNVDLILKIGLNNYLLEILKRPKLSAVQAGLLLLQCKNVIQANVGKGSTNGAKSPPAFGASTGTSANGGPQGQNGRPLGDSDYSDWVLCSQVVSLAEELGLGLDCNNWKLPKWERGLRKRLAWAVYMEDKWLSLKNSRPSHINENNWVVLSLVEEDFPEKHGDGDLKEGSSDIDNGKKIFRNFIELSMILSDIINQFYSMRSMIEVTEVNQVLKLAKPLQLKLRNWYHSLPVELHMSSVQPRKLCSNGYLQLAYFATELSLHRKISTVIYQQTLAGNAPPPELVNVCRTAAKTRLLGSIEFVRDLKPEHIHSFWHSSAASNFTLIGTFAAILFMSAPSKEEADFYRDQIFNYRWILKMSSKGFDQVAEALSQLDLVLNHIPGLLNDNAELPMVVPNVPSYPSQKQSEQRTNNTRPSLPSQHQSYTNGSQPHNQRVRALHGRTNSQPTGGDTSPYNSPQNFTQITGNITSPHQQQQTQSQQTMSRGGQFIINSPQSSQGLSPKEIIKQQRSVRNDLMDYERPSSQNQGQGQTPNHGSSQINKNVKRSPSSLHSTALVSRNDSDSEDDDE